jgi:hypothetical protein
MQKTKEALVKDWSSLKTITKNVFEFTDGICLASVSGFSIYEALNHRSMWYKALLFAGLVIALQAFVLLVRHFNKAN